MSHPLHPLFPFVFPRVGDKKVRAHLSEKRLLRIPPRKLFCAIGIEQFCAAQFSEGLEGVNWRVARENRALSLSPLSAVISREEEFCQTAQSRVKRKRGRKEGRERERGKEVAKKDTFFP